MHWLTTFDPKTLGNSVAGDPQTRTMFNSCVVGVTLLTFKNHSPGTLADYLSDFARGLPRKSCVPLLMRSSWCPTYRRSYWKASVKGPMQDCAVPFAWWHLDCGECCIGSHRNAVEELRIGIFGDLFFIRIFLKLWTTLCCDRSNRICRCCFTFGACIHAKELAGKV